jgi:tetratricopeptide (TPR) repeat protein
LPASPEIPTSQAAEARAEEANKAIDLASAEARAAGQEAAAATESEASALRSAGVSPHGISSLPSDRGDVAAQEAAREAAESARIEAEREAKDLSAIGRAEAAGKGSTLNLAPPPAPLEPASTEAMRNLSQGSSQMGANEAGAARRARPALPGMPSGENSRSETPQDPGSLLAGGLIQELTAADEHYNAGVRLFKAGSVDEAIAEYRKAVELDPTHVLAYTQLGIALYRKGEIDGAVAALESAYELNPESEVLKQLIERLRGR